MTPATREALREAARTLDLYARQAQKTADDWAGMTAARKDARTRQLHRNFAAVCRGLARAARQLSEAEPASPPEPYNQEPE